MLKYCIILLSFLIIVCSSLAFAELSSSEFVYYQNGQRSWFDSLDVRFVGNWPFGVESKGVAFDSIRNLMFLASSGGVYILDVSNPQDPTKLSEQIHTRSYIYDLFYVDSVQRLYIADDVAGLEIWDVTDPVSPQKLGFCDTPDLATGVYVLGSYAYVADNNSLRIIDISTPTNPQEVGFCDTVEHPVNVHVSGSYAYLAADEALVIVDVSTPTNPQIVGYWESPVLAYDVNVSGSYAYVTDLGVYGVPEDSVIFYVVDISTPSNPSEVGRLVLQEDSWNYVCELHVCDTFAYVVCDTLWVINIADPFNPQKVGKSDEGGNSIYAAGDYAYVASNSGGLVIDISTPSDPQLIGQYEIPGSAIDVFISEPYAYLADGYAGMRIIDISTLTNPFEIGNCQINGCAWSVFVVGSYAYITYTDYDFNNYIHLTVIDISDPSNPQEVGSCFTPNSGEAWGDSCIRFLCVCSGPKLDCWRTGWTLDN